MDAKFILKIYSVFWLAPVFFLAWVVGKPKASRTNQDALRVLRYLFNFYTARRSFASDLAYLRFDLTFSQLKTESLQYKERKVSKKRKTYFTQQTKQMPPVFRFWTQTIEVCFKSLMLQNDSRIFDCYKVCRLAKNTPLPQGARGAAGWSLSYGLRY